MNLYTQIYVCVFTRLPIMFVDTVDFAARTAAIATQQNPCPARPGEHGASYPLYHSVAAPPCAWGRSKPFDANWQGGRPACPAKDKPRVVQQRQTCPSL